MAIEDHGCAGVGSLRRDLGRELGTSVELFRTLLGPGPSPIAGEKIWQF